MCLRETLSRCRVTVFEDEEVRGVLDKDEHTQHTMDTLSPDFKHILRTCLHRIIHDYRMWRFERCVSAGERGGMITTIRERR